MNIDDNQRYDVYFVTRSHGRGSPVDGSESWSSETECVIIPIDERDEFGEYMADEYGSQDYSYQVSDKCVLEAILGENLRKLRTALLQEESR